MQIAGRIVGATAVLVLVLAAAAAAGAQSPSTPSSQSAVDVYVEELPTATGSVAAGPTPVAAQAPSSVSGTEAGGSGGLLGLGLVLAGTTVAIILGRLRDGRESRH